MSETIRKGMPPAVRDRYTVRCTEHKFGPNSKGNPMITLNWEVVGLGPLHGEIKTEVKQGGTTYYIAGCRVQPSYFTLTDNAISYYEDFLKLMGVSNPEVDRENPDLSLFEQGLMCQVMLTAASVVERKALTEDDRAEGKTVGDPVLDEDGNPMMRDQVVISSFIKRYEGEVPANAQF